MGNVRLKVLHLRKWKNADGSEGKYWTQVGVAFTGTKGIDIDLQYLPTTPGEDGRVRLVLREDDGRPAQPEGGYQGERGGRQRVTQPFRDPELPPQRPQAPQGGPGQPGLRPQHRDALQGGQQATYGGAAAQREREPGDDDLPF
jgi:hypothetical protein